MKIFECSDVKTKEVVITLSYVEAQQLHDAVKLAADANKKKVVWKELLKQLDDELNVY